MKLYYEDKYLLFDRPGEKNLKYFIKRFLYVFSSAKYKFLLNFVRPRDSGGVKKYKVSVCAIFRDEGEILREWIEFHKLVGVEHFYLYNNFSEDDYKEILAPYIEDGTVTLTDWPYPQAQMKAYEDCVKNHAAETKWLGFIDLDEFVVPNRQYNKIYDFLKQFDKKRASVIIYWRYFGSSGKIDRNRGGLVTEAFTSCYYKYADIGKYFFNTDYSYYPSERHTGGYMHHHWCSLRGIDLPPVNVFDKVCVWGQNRCASREVPVQINHYLLKSYNEYKEKKAKRGGGVHKIQKGFHDDEYFFRHDSFCQSTDHNILKYMVRLKLSLGIKE